MNMHVSTKINKLTPTKIVHPQPHIHTLYRHLLSTYSFAKMTAKRCENDFMYKHTQQSISSYEHAH